MQIKTDGIVLRTVKYGENQLIVDILTEEFGLKTYMIYGARSAKSKKKGIYTVPNILTIDAVHKDNKSMDQVQDQGLSYTYQSIPFDFFKMSTAMFVAELASKVLKKSDAGTSTFEFIKNYLLWLDGNEKGFHLLPLHFMIAWLPDHGIEFHLQEGDWFPYFDFAEGKFMPQKPTHPFYVDGPELDLFKNLASASLDDLPSIKSNRASRNLLMDRLLYFYRNNIEGLSELKSIQILREII